MQAAAASRTAAPSLSDGRSPSARHRVAPRGIPPAPPAPEGTGERRAAGGLGGVAVALCAAVLAQAQAPFAAQVIDYAPAPGQFVSDPFYNDPAKALGRPHAGGFSEPGNSSLVSLGGFGGSVTLRFVPPVMDDPANPFGLDAIVYGNAFYVAGSPNRRWAECGHIEISRDVNGNGLADDPWYLIPGSHITSLRPRPQGGQLEWQTWDDNIDDPTFPPDDETWLPPGASGTWTTWAWRLPPAIFETFVVQNPNGLAATEEGIWGYADFTPTLKLGDTNGDNIIDDPNARPEIFYTRPDNPLKVGITPGSGGGDAFDIAWAVDPATGAPVGLDGFDFIRLTTAVNRAMFSPPLGELSTEIDAVADVAPGAMGDSEGDGDIDHADFVLLASCLAGEHAVVPTCPCRIHDFDHDGDVDLRDLAAFQAVFTGT
ncbi:MAG: hypothetical protein IPM13_09670 [Phycisphaerales bacterium]|nr:hypothetical protein [Phycisphaerales bacterium]